MATKRYRRDFKTLELRRRKGMRMLARGIAQADVARTLEVQLAGLPLGARVDTVA